MDTSASKIENVQRPTSNGAVARGFGETAGCFDPAGLVDSQCSTVATSIPDVANPAIPSWTTSAGSAFPSSRIVFTLIAFLLMFTAIAKLWMLLTDSFADVRVGISKEILWFSVLFEFGLAYLNLRLKDVRILAFINTVVFASFGFFAMTRWLLGYRSCGCSGNVEIPITVFVAVDLAIVFFFMAKASQRQNVVLGMISSFNWWTRLRLATKAKIQGIVCLIFLVVLFQLPGFSDVLNALWGELPVVAVVAVDGELSVGKQVQGTVKLYNYSDRTAKVIGGNSSCTCFQILENPSFQSVPARGNLLLPIAITPNKNGLVFQRVVLYLDHPEQFMVNVDLIGFSKGEQQ